MTAITIASAVIVLSAIFIFKKQYKYKRSHPEQYAWMLTIHEAEKTGQADEESYTEAVSGLMQKNQSFSSQEIENIGSRLESFKTEQSRALAEKIFEYPNVSSE